MEWETERSIIFTRSSPRSLSLIHQPLSAGAKRVKEDWKSLFFYGFMGSMVFGTAVIYYKPNTNVHTWAYREAKTRMEAHGESVEYKKQEEKNTA
ncbi:hypothetical protein CPB97_003797 [Podila verticillata]|nr:hypothetical protein CPB97_003797 [Podila verticillata]